MPQEELYWTEFGEITATAKYEIQKDWQLGNFPQAHLGS